MIDLQTLLLFSVAVLALLASPGPNMAFLLSHGLSHGARGGLGVAFGIFLADLILTALTAMGVTAAITAWAPSFDIMRYLGAIYLLWLAIQALRSGSVGRLEEKIEATTWQIVRAAMLNSLLNPKALLFFMVFLPQFVQPAKGNVPLQLCTLGIVLSLLAFAFHGALGISSARVAAVFVRSSGHSRYFGWFQAGLFTALAARLLVLDRPSR